MKTLSFLKHCLPAILAVSAVLASCKKDDPVSPERAEEAVSSIRLNAAITATSNGPLYAYSTIELILDEDHVMLAHLRGVYLMWTYDSISVEIEGVRTKITYDIDIENNRATIAPDPYFAITGTLTLTLHMSILYSPTPDALPVDNSDWRLLRTETETVQYRVFNSLPGQALKQPAQGTVNATIYYVPSVGVRMSPDNYKYEITPSLSLNGTPKPLIADRANDSLYYFNYTGTLESGRTYALSVTAKWYHKTGETWASCDARFDETVTWLINTTENASITLSAEDFEFSYPSDRQVNFLRKEYGKGYFRLYDREKMKMMDHHRSYIRIKDVKYEDFMAGQEEIAFNSTLNVLEYVMPNILEPQRVYKAEIMEAATGQALCAYFFRTGKFDNFMEKWTALQTSFISKEKWRDLQTIEDYWVHIQKFNIKNPEEILDWYEADGHHPEIMPLIQFETHVDEWWKTTSDWLIYGQPSLLFNRRNDGYKKFEFPPVRAIVFEASPVLLSDEQCVSGNVTLPTYPEYKSVFSWYVQAMTYWDSFSARDNAQKIPKAQRTKWQIIAAEDYKDMPYLNLDFVFGDPPDSYPLMDAFYVLPGINVETTVIRNIQLP